MLACHSGYAPALSRAGEMVARFGRMKYLKPIYRALASRPETKPLAQELFEKHRASYHPIAQQVIRLVLK